MGHQLAVTWQHMRRSPYQAAAAIMIMILTIFVGLIFTMISFGSQRLLIYLEQKPQVIAFFKDTITQDNQIKNLYDELNATGKVGKLKFVSKDEALKIYQQRNKNDPLLLELVTANTLPASLEVSANNVADLPSLYEILKKAQNIEEISYQRDIVNALINVLDKIRKFGVGLVAFLVTTSLFTILTIIGMKIALRKEEIEVQRLVGASKWYVRTPFLLEGLFYGATGAIISWSIIYLLIILLTPYLLPYLSGLSLLPVSFPLMLQFLAGTVVFGSLVGILGSFLAVWRYLD